MTPETTDGQPHKTSGRYYYCYGCDAGSDGWLCTKCASGGPLLHAAITILIDKYPLRARVNDPIPDDFVRYMLEHDMRWVIQRAREHGAQTA